MSRTIRKPDGRLNDICGRLGEMSADIFGHLRTSSDISDNPPVNEHRQFGSDVEREHIAGALTTARVDLDTPPERIHVDARTVWRWVDKLSPTPATKRQSAAAGPSRPLY